jgi:hypothetical protein
MALEWGGRLLIKVIQQVYLVYLALAMAFD